LHKIRDIINSIESSAMALTTLGGIDKKVLELIPDTRLGWNVVAGPVEWLGTSIRFDIAPGDDWNSVRFMHHCNTQRGVFLLRLKSFLQSGKGTPVSNETKLDNWE
jgi:hypothetical protein